MRLAHPPHAELRRLGIRHARTHRRNLFLVNIRTQPKVYPHNLAGKQKDHPCNKSVSYRVPTILQTSIKSDSAKTSNPARNARKSANAADPGISGQAFAGVIAPLRADPKVIVHATPVFDATHDSGLIDSGKRYPDISVDSIGLSRYDETGKSY
jgi:hypothetical protein